MRRRRIEVALAAMAAALIAGVACAQSVSIPANISTIARVSDPGRLLVRGLDGREVAIDLAGYDLAEFALFAGGRYLGFLRSAHEDYGYILVDRAAQGAAAVMETGHAPVFSTDGRYFASAELSEAGFGNLEGLALWEVRPDRTIRRLFTDALPRSFDWRVDGWPRPACAAISAIDLNWQPPEGVDHAEGLRDAQRLHYRLEVDDESVTLRGAGGAVCEPEG